MAATFVTAISKNINYINDYSEAKLLFYSNNFANSLFLLDFHAPL